MLSGAIAAVPPAPIASTYLVHGDLPAVDNTPAQIITPALRYLSGASLSPFSLSAVMPVVQSQLPGGSAALVDEDAANSATEHEADDAAGEEDDEEEEEDEEEDGEEDEDVATAGGATGMAARTRSHTAAAAAAPTRQAGSLSHEQRQATGVEPQPDPLIGPHLSAEMEEGAGIPTDHGQLEFSRELLVDGGVRLRLGMKRSRPDKPWPRWSLRLADGDGFSVDLDTLDETGNSQLASLVATQPAAPSYFHQMKTEQEVANAGIIQLEQAHPAGQQLTLATTEPINAFAAYQSADGRIGRLAVQPAARWLQPGAAAGPTASEVDPTAGAADDWQMGTPMVKRRRNSNLDPWHAAAATDEMTPTTAGSAASGCDAWNQTAAVGVDSAGSAESDEAAQLAAGANGNHLVAAAVAAAQQQMAAGADVMGNAAAGTAQQQSLGFQMSYLPAMQASRAAAAAASGMLPYMQYHPQLMHPQFGSPMVHPFALQAQRGLMMSSGMPGSMGADRVLGKRRSKHGHGLDDGGYENSEERNFTEAEKKRLREAPWPDKKRPTGLPTLYCHLCYLREGVFRVVSAISPNPDTVYFRHQQCHTSFKRGEDLPKRIVDMYQRWYKKRALANQQAAASRAELALGRGGRSAGNSPTGGSSSVDHND